MVSMPMACLSCSMTTKICKIGRMRFHLRVCKCVGCWGWGLGGCHACWELCTCLPALHATLHPEIDGNAPARQGSMCQSMPRVKWLTAVRLKDSSFFSFLCPSPNSPLLSWGLAAPSWHPTCAVAATGAASMTIPFMHAVWWQALQATDAAREPLPVSYGAHQKCRPPSPSGTLMETAQPTARGHKKKALPLPKPATQASKHLSACALVQYNCHSFPQVLNI